jgi:hypothetical protein
MCAAMVVDMPSSVIGGEMLKNNAGPKPFVHTRGNDHSFYVLDLICADGKRMTIDFVQEIWDGSIRVDLSDGRRFLMRPTATAHNRIYWISHARRQASVVDRNNEWFYFSENIGQPTPSYFQCAEPKNKQQSHQ